jgi:FtsZ-binding cell division protein ZapB
MRVHKIVSRTSAHLEIELDRIPHLPPAETESQSFTDSPYRAHLPFHPGIPYVVDPSSLQMAVQHDPQHMFHAIRLLVKEREELREANNILRTENNTLKAERNTLSIENKSLAENFESARLDYRVARDKLDKMEQICSLQSAKQVILWKFIERLQNGQEGPVGGEGYWKERNGSPMTAVSETSEPSSDRSTSSTAASKDSSDTRLDPNAVSSITCKSGEVLTSFQQAFVPQSGSPPGSFEQKKQNDPNQVASEALKQVIVTLPARYFGVCPNSISSPGPCPVPHCRLQPVCEDFNDEIGPGCKNRSCIFAHVYRTCTEMLDGVGCSYMNVNERSTKKEGHMKKRIHPCGGFMISQSEWKLREAIGGLREAHKESRY